MNEMDSSSLDSLDDTGIILYIFKGNRYDFYTYTARESEKFTFKGGGKSVAFCYNVKIGGVIKP